MNIKHRNITVGTCRVANISGARAAGRHILKIHLALTMHGFRSAESGAIVWLGGEIDTPAGKCWLRPILDEIGLAPHDRELVIEADLDAKQVRLVEESRLATGRVQLTLHLRYLINVESKGGVVSSYTSIQAEANESTWLEFLSSSGFDERQSADFVLVRPGQTEELSKAAGELKDAWVSYRKRDWKGVLTNCRRAFEHMPSVGQPQALDLSWDLPTRIRNANAAVRAILHAGAHTGIGDPDQGDARAVLLMTSTILDRCNRV